MSIQVIRPKNEREREGIYRFLYEIWSDEFHRSMEGMDHEHRLLHDALDETAQHFVAIDPSGRIQGCVRVNMLGNTALPEKLQAQLRTVELIKLFGGEQVYYLSHFAVAPEARGRTVASLLLGALYGLCLDQGALVGISYCSLQFISFYYQLGYRPYTENFRIDAGIRVPIVHCARDRAYLEEIKSPLARLCPSAIDDKGAAARKLINQFPAFKNPAFGRKKPHHLWARLAHMMPDDTAAGRNNFFAGFSVDEQRILGQRLTEITFSQGEHIYRRGETEQGMGVLMSGSLGVEFSASGPSRIIYVMQPGELFGEIGSLGGERRTVSLVALERSQALLFPSDLLERAERADPALGFTLAKKLLKILATRFVHFAETVGCLSGSGADQAGNNRPTRLHDPNTTMMNSRLDSYRFESLGDRESEFKRLVAQATIGEEIEFSVLDSIGLHDGATVLDLGSGPGMTSLLLAKRLPSAVVIGVEPEDQLRVKAETLIASQGFAERCRFLKGTGDRIPLDNGAVDFSYARLLFQHLPNPLAVLKEMRRVTRPGGVVVVVDVDDRTNIVHPAPAGLEDLEKRIAVAQAAAGGDRHVGRKLYGYLQAIGLQEVNVQHVPITASALGRHAFFSIVYSFKRQVLERAGECDPQTIALFHELEHVISRPTTFAMTTVFVAYGVPPP